ncbi:alpha/beta hydrolase [Microbacterium sp. NPDC003461]
MQLDPLFAERLRRERKYWVSQALRRLKTRLGWPWFMRPTAEQGVEAASPAEKDVARRAARAETQKAIREHRPHASQRRAAHRRQARNWDRKELAKSGVPGPEVRTAEHVVPVEGYPDVRVRVYYPTADWDIAAEGPIPACLTFFGGAFRIGGIDFPTTDAVNRRRAAEARVAMVAVDYALAPEQRFPTQVEQGLAALRWLFDRADELGFDAGRVALQGTSAGGNIAAAVALANRDRDALPLRGQLLEVPVVDLTGRHIDFAATRALGIPTIIMARELLSVARTYLPHRRDAKNPLASPIRAASLAGLPPAVVFTAEYDPLRGDGAAYAAALREAGVEASAVQYLGVPHDAAVYAGVLPAARRWHRDVVAALRLLHD